MRIPATVALAAGAALIVLPLVLGSWYTIDQTERGVVLRNGAIHAVAQPGLGFKLPFVDSVARIPVRNQLLRWERLEGYSHDQQTAHYMISVNYQFESGRVAEVYADYGGADAAVARLLTPLVLKQSKVVIGRFTAQSVIQDRARLNAEITDAIQKAVSGPITVTGVNVEDIKFSPAYEKSIEDRMLAEVEVLRLRQNAEREKVQAQITVTKATADADAVRAQAQAQAEAIRIKGMAEAEAIRARGDALRDNPSLVTLVQAERWDGRLPSTMVPGGTLPMLALSGNAK
ncbi:band 7 protein [Methylobacterium sp. 4-46]|uniref:prohibitin family protein n=1 Tax=unclassified Methylobacterium TaxID=2615210 RepID=UPI000165C804|nr:MULTISPECIES: prohibitin family protein [Methylobacterium]ACA18418.1 band 7 protein [Methylobacterium sp. 4-46]WFT77706.1 prohibitin family protein [Methylobacterium nodulans]